jgi:hypothetical protein
MAMFYASESETQSATTLPAGVNAEARWALGVDYR